MKKKRGQERSRFKYKKRSRDSVHKRATQRGGMFDSYIKQEFPTFAPKEGTHKVRILPPTWDGAEHYGYDIYVVYNIGSDSQSYLSLSKMKGDPDPIDEERRRADSSDRPDYAKSLAPTQRVCCWIIDRKNEKEGPMLWAMPWTVDKEIALLLEDEDSGEVICVDDPNEGYDISFTRDGSGLKTKYVGLKIGRYDSALHEDEDTQDEWLEYVQANPVPDCLQYYSYEHIDKVFSGAVPQDEDDDEDDRKPKRGRKGKRREEEEEPEDDKEDKPKGRGKRSRDDDEDEDERPRGRRRRPRDEEEPEDDNDKEKEEPEEEEEEKPRRRGKTRRSSRDDDEEEEERPKRGKKRSRRDDDDGEEEPEDEDRETTTKKLRKLKNRRGD